ncbi:MAG: AI-2E family transporter [Clostridia bacterium]|nr:AI-2E family transporter [Clostridia bacterium]
MKNTWKKCLCAGVTLFLLFLCTHYWGTVVEILSGILSAATPLIIGCIIAYLVNIPMSFYEKHYFPKKKSGGIANSRNIVCMLAAYLTFVAIIALLIIIVVPELVDCIEFLGITIVNWFKTIDTTKLAQLLPAEAISALKNADWQSILDKAIAFLSAGISGVTTTIFDIVGGLFSGIVTALVSLIFSIYILSNKEKLKNQFSRLMKNYLKPKWNSGAQYVLSTLNDCFRKYTVGQCMEAVILGSLCALGMLIFKMPYAAMIGTLIGFTALIPVAGAYIGAGIGAFMILTVSPIKAVWFLVFIVILQQLEGNIIYPRVVGSSIGLPGIWVLAAVTIGGGLFGILGMLIGVPIAAALYRMLRANLNKKESEAQKNLPVVNSQL